MNVVVLVKEVPDPEGVYNLDENQNVVTANLARIPNMFDENALEAAIQMKETNGARITAICFGTANSDKTLLHAYAMGVDDAVLIEDASGMEFNSYATAEVLAAGIKKIGSPDLILCGRESSDAGAGLVGPLVAHLLEIPFLTLVTGIQLKNGALHVKRLAEGGYDIFECTMPILLTVSGEINVPRYPSVLKILQAKKKPIQRWQVNDLFSKPSQVPINDMNKVRLIRRYLPELVGQCRFIEGSTDEEKVLDLINMLTEERLI